MRGQRELRAFGRVGHAKLSHYWDGVVPRPTAFGNDLPTETSRSGAPESG